MIIAYGSDLHLEFGTKGLVEQIEKIDADVLVLAGDIACVDDFVNMHKPDTSRSRKDIKLFFDAVDDKFKKTIMVLGNHEHYRGVVETTATKIKNSIAEHYSNIQLLDDNYTVFDNTVFFGSTMWTDMGNPVTHFMIANSMNDFKIIRSNQNGNYIRFTPAMAATMHTESLNKLEETSQIVGNKKFVVVQHHAPSERSVAPLYQTSKLNPAYHSSIMENRLLNMHTPPDLIIHGHMHTPSNYYIGKTHVVANPRGYQGHESCAERFEFDLYSL